MVESNLAPVRADVFDFRTASKASQPATRLGMALGLAADGAYLSQPH